MKRIMAYFCGILAANRRIAAPAGAAGVFFFGFAPAAHADILGSGTLGDVFCNAYLNLYPFADFYDFIAYTIGAYLIAHGIYMLGKHFEDREQKLRTAIFRLAAGSGMMALPALVDTLVTTMFFGQGGGAGLNTCMPDGGGTQTATTLDVMLENAVANIQQPFVATISIIATLMGLFMIIHGLHHSARHGYDPNGHSMVKIIANFVVGTSLVALGSSFSVILGSLFGLGAGNELNAAPILSWTMIQNLTTDPTAQAHIQGAMTAALSVVQMVGLIAFVRGLSIMKKAAEGSSQATMPQGLTHLIGGVLAINIYQFLSIMDATFGTNFF